MVKVQLFLLNTDFLSEKKLDKEPFVWTVKTWTKEITRANQKSICQLWLDSFNLNYLLQLLQEELRNPLPFQISLRIQFSKVTIQYSNITYFFTFTASLGSNALDKAKVKIYKNIMNKKQIKDNVTFKFSENRVNICM